MKVRTLLVVSLLAVITGCCGPRPLICATERVPGTAQYPLCPVAGEKELVIPVDPTFLPTVLILVGVALALHLLVSVMP